jgi:septal ring factor EnvC (AmiA/AmiB activator)
VLSRPHSNNLFVALKKLTRDLKDLAHDLKKLTRDLKELARDLKELARKLKKLTRDLKELAHDLKKLAHGLKKLACDLRILSRAPPSLRLLYSAISHHNVISMTHRDRLLQELSTFPDDRLTQALEWLRSPQPQPERSSAEVWADLMQQLQSPQSLEQSARNQALSSLLQSWEEEGDPQEQRETWEFLSQAIDRDRLSNRPLYP